MSSAHHHKKHKENQVNNTKRGTEPCRATHARPLSAPPALLPDVRLRVVEVLPQRHLLVHVRPHLRAQLLRLRERRGGVAARGHAVRRDARVPTPLLRLGVPPPRTDCRAVPRTRLGSDHPSIVIHHLPHNVVENLRRRASRGLPPSGGGAPERRCGGRSQRGKTVQAAPDLVVLVARCEVQRPGTPAEGPLPAATLRGAAGERGQEAPGASSRGTQLPRGNWRGSTEPAPRAPARPSQRPGGAHP